MLENGYCTLYPSVSVCRKAMMSLISSGDNIAIAMVRVLTNHITKKHVANLMKITNFIKLVDEQYI